MWRAFEIKCNPLYFLHRKLNALEGSFTLKPIPKRNTSNNTYRICKLRICLVGIDEIDLTNDNYSHNEHKVFLPAPKLSMFSLLLHQNGLINTQVMKYNWLYQVFYIVLKILLFRLLVPVYKLNHPILSQNF